MTETLRHQDNPVNISRLFYREFIRVMTRIAQELLEQMSFQLPSELQVNTPILHHIITICTSNINKSQLMDSLGDQYVYLRHKGLSKIAWELIREKIYIWQY